MIKTKPISHYKCKCGCGEQAAFVAGIFKFHSSECVNTEAVKILKKEKVQQVKTRKAETRKMKDASNMTIKYWKSKAQAVFNKWIRLRDNLQPCISCNITNEEAALLPPRVGGFWDAGHYLSRGAYPELRFTEDNCHKQCKKCNGGSKYSLKGKSVGEGYDAGILKRIGLKRSNALAHKHELPHWKAEDYKEIHRVYSQRLKVQINENQ